MTSISHRDAVLGAEAARPSSRYRDPASAKIPAAATSAHVPQDSRRANTQHKRSALNRRIDSTLLTLVVQTASALASHIVGLQQTTMHLAERK
jgi:hypothetical protein